MLKKMRTFCSTATLLICFLALTTFCVFAKIFLFRLINIENLIRKPRLGENKIEGKYMRQTYSMSNNPDLTDIEKPFFHVTFSNIFIFSAIEVDNCALLGNESFAKNSFTRLGACNKSLDVHVIGWEHKDYESQSVKCCYLWETGNISEYHKPNRIYFNRNQPVVLRSSHYECRLERRKVTLRGVHMQVGKSSCANVRDRYVQPVQPSIPTNSGMIAICLKFLFGNVDALWLVEWFEYYKEMKVDKVFLTVYKDVSEQVRRVVQFYIEEGFVEMKPYDYPWKTDVVRSLDQKIDQVWEDKRVIISDFNVRYRGYTYTMIIDLDEFLVPAEGNIKTLMSRLMRANSTAAGFTFKSTLIIRSWGNSSMYGSSVVSQYLQGTTSSLTRCKYIAVSNRTVVGRSLSHNYKPMENFKQIFVPEDLALVYHYRSHCYNDQDELCNGTRYKRTNVQRIIKKVEPLSLAVKRKLALI